MEKENKGTVTISLKRYKQLENFEEVLENNSVFIDNTHNWLNPLTIYAKDAYCIKMAQVIQKLREELVYYRQKYLESDELEDKLVCILEEKFRNMSITEFKEWKKLNK